jgi:hypothetical protein
VAKEGRDVNELVQRDRLERVRAALQAALAIVEEELAGCTEALDEDRLITPKAGAFLLKKSYQTIHRWQAKHPAALGVQRIGGQILMSERLLIAFARRRQPREK